MAGTERVINSSSSSPDSQKPPTSTHRLATVSASDALANLNGGAKSAISTGIDSLNRVLVGSPSADTGGFEQGKVAEIWGPSGSGKTGLAFQTVYETLKGGGRVTWVASAAPLSGTRLTAMDDKIREQQSGETEEAESYEPHERLQQYSVRTLSHLLALILHSPSTFLQQGTTLLVIDDLQTLIDRDYPRMPFGNASRSDQQKWQATRRYAVLGSLVTALGKLAVMHDMAVIVTTGCASRPRHDTGLGAALAPGAGGSEWESGVWSRTVLFRDFNGRFAGVQKCNGRNLTPLDPVGDIRNVTGFEISAGGWLKEQVIDLTSSAPQANTRQPSKAASSPANAVRKRNYEEIADSDEDADEYGWAEKDEDVIAGGRLVDEHKPANVEVQDNAPDNNQP